jgi:hypothetical protein
MPLTRVRRARCLRTLAFVLLSGCAGPTGPKEDVLVLEVAPTRVPCFGPFPRDCLQVRERPDAQWQRFYQEIEGFTHEPGYQYTLRVAVRAVPNPPADGSSVAYRLLAILSRASG